MTDRPVHLGLDIGTSGCRIAAITADASLVAELALPLPAPDVPEAGWAQQDPAIWWDTVYRLLHLYNDRYPDLVPRTLAIDGTSATLLICDPSGTPLQPALMYNDRRAQHALTLLQRVAPAQSPTLSASSSLAKALYLYQRYAGQRSLHLQHQSDWLLGMLAGRFDLSDENNCLKLGYDAVASCWPEWLQALPIPAGCYPRVYPTGTPVARIAPAMAQRLRLPADLKLVSGTTDSTAAVLATGICTPGQAVSSLGTTLVLKILSEVPVFASEYGVYSQRIGDLWLVGGASNSGGNVLKAHFTDEEICRYSDRVRPEVPSGLDYYPLSSQGERFPHNDPLLRPRLTPVPADRAQFFQGILEGIARIEATGYRLLMGLGAPEVSEVFSIGGGAANEPWRQIRQAMLGRPVLRAIQQQAAYGAALLALRAAADDITSD